MTKISESWSPVKKKLISKVCHTRQKPYFEVCETKLKQIPTEKFLMIVILVQTRFRYQLASKCKYCNQYNFGKPSKSIT